MMKKIFRIIVVVLAIATVSVTSAIAGHRFLGDYLADLAQTKGYGYHTSSVGMGPNWTHTFLYFKSWLFPAAETVAYFVKDNNISYVVNPDLKNLEGLSEEIFITTVLKKYLDLNHLRSLGAGIGSIIGGSLGGLVGGMGYVIHRKTRSKQK